MNQNVSTQQFVDIESIKDGVLVLKNGSLRKVLMVSGINFDLKSEEEQGIIISSFQNFLNTLEFSIQFLVHSRKMNISAYLEKLRAREDQEENELLKNQISEYIEFVRAFVENNAVMAKTFFAVVPYDSIQISKVGGNILSNLKFWEKNKNTEIKNEDLEQKIMKISQRAEQVVNGLNQIGLRAVTLNDEELTELFYNLYNPSDAEKKDIKIAKSNRE
jgi:type IV secretory pathway VirB4 component